MGSGEAISVLKLVFITGLITVKLEVIRFTSSVYLMAAELFARLAIFNFSLIPANPLPRHVSIFSPALSSLFDFNNS
jgi:hypothetical protein